MAGGASVGTAAEGAHDSGGFWYTWWRGDALPDLAPLPGFACEAHADPMWIVHATASSLSEARARLATGHRCYVARMDAAVAGFGWSATTRAEIGELGVALALPRGNHYLWDFETFPYWRGQGVYPALLQAILRREEAEAARFWIGHEPGNDASARGILRAGFLRVGELWLLPGGAMALHAEAPAERAEASAAVLGVPLMP